MVVLIVPVVSKNLLFTLGLNPSRTDLTVGELSFVGRGSYDEINIFESLSF